MEAERLELEELRAEKAKREAAEFKRICEEDEDIAEGNLVEIATTHDYSKEQLLLVCDALFYIKLPESLGKYRGRVKSILTETIEEIRGLAE